jgi:hypothetical protein
VKSARPFNKRGALVACLVGGLVISFFSFMQLGVVENQIRSRCLSYLMQPVSPLKQFLNLNKRPFKYALSRYYLAVLQTPAYARNIL